MANAITIGLISFVLFLMIGTAVFLILTRKKKNPMQHMYPQHYMQGQTTPQWQQPMNQPTQHTYQPHLQHQQQNPFQQGIFNPFEEKQYAISITIQQPHTTLSPDEQNKMHEQAVAIMEDHIKKMENAYKKAKINVDVMRA